MKKPVKEMCTNDWQALYREREEWLNDHYTQLEPLEFYRELFPPGSLQEPCVSNDGKGNAIVLEIIEKDGKQKRRRYTISDDLAGIEKFKDSDLAFMSPVSYFGKERKSDNGRELFAFTIDLDGITSSQHFENLFHQFQTGVTLEPTWLVLSGRGVHLYYQLDTPMPLQHFRHRVLKAVKYGLVYSVWNDAVTIKSDAPEYQGIWQGFRVIGSRSRLGKDYPVRAWRLGLADYTVEEIATFLKEWNIDKKEFMKDANLSMSRYPENPLYLAEEEWPDWYNRRIVKKEAPGKWRIKRDLYDWWLKTIQEGKTVGHRYWCIWTLAAYAKKCDIEEEELKKDALSLVSSFNAISAAGEEFTENDALAALDSYQDEMSNRLRRDTIARLSGIDIPKGKRNGRTRETHLARARTVQEYDYPNGSWRNAKGRPSAKQLVENYLQEHPSEKNKSKIARELHIERHTVAKHMKKMK